MALADMSGVCPLPRPTNQALPWELSPLKRILDSAAPSPRPAQSDTSSVSSHATADQVADAKSGLAAAVKSPQELARGFGH